LVKKKVREGEGQGKGRRNRFEDGEISGQRKGLPLKKTKYLLGKRSCGGGGGKTRPEAKFTQKKVQKERPP